MTHADAPPDPEQQLATLAAELAEAGLPDLPAELAELLATLPDDQREAVLPAIRRVLAGDLAVVDELREQRQAAKAAEARALAALRVMAIMTVDTEQPGARSPHGESAFVRRSGVDRMTVRRWLGKR